MTSAAGSTLEPVRLLFEMTRDDNPRLYDDLIRFNKGTKRVNRLRFLAHEGLLAQHCTVASGVATPALPIGPSGQPTISPSAARHTNQAFDDPPVAP